MRPSFTRLPRRADAVSEPCPDREGALDLLCADCGWEGHADHADRWVVFMAHACRLRTESVGSES